MANHPPLDLRRAANATACDEAHPAGGVGSCLPHASALLHVSGEATYTDDIIEPRNTLHAALGLSSRAHARIEAIDFAPVISAPGVVAVLTAADIPGLNDFGPVVEDDPILAEEEVRFHGQPIFIVVAESAQLARRAARLARIDYAPLPALLTVEDALAAGSRVLPDTCMRRGDPESAIAAAPRRLAGSVRCGGQDHFYLEGQVALALPLEDGTLHVHSATQHPGEVQLQVANALGVTAKDVVVECRRMGGGFGGKESQPGQIAALAAIAARRLGRPVKLRLDRDTDMIMTGKRHDFRIDYEVGFDDEGRLLGLRMTHALRAGHSADLSGAIADRALLHADNAYFLPDVAVDSLRLRTHTVSNTAFRGFGGPQGMFGIEEVIDVIARALGLDPLEVRKRNYYGLGERDVTPYGQRVSGNLLHEMTAALEADANYHARRLALRDWNRSSTIIKRGLALTPVKFGISFTTTHLNQAGALLHLYTDGTVLLSHGGTEMGQGLHTKVAQVVAEELQIDIDRIRIAPTDTSKVPNAPATAASSGADLNGKAAQQAAQKIKARLARFAAERYRIPQHEVVFRDNHILIGEQSVPFAELVRAAWKARVSLSATGFYRTPDIVFDRERFVGRPFYYFAYGVACSEVAIDTLTGEARVLRADLLHDAGRSLNPALDRGQVEGGFVQGMGWLTMEELSWDNAGRLQTHAPSTYKIPAVSDLPADFRVRLWPRGENTEETIFRSKAVGEPPLMLALSVWHAIKDAIAAVADHAITPRLNAPASAEEILRSVAEVRRRAAEGAAAVDACPASLDPDMPT
ncbi:MAG: xanthine dehydrogenase molybdopterin binding subunit [Thauera sp.]|nr:xanthine dehydrogenase molybdopterin binding subunit [Thauera sp.]